MTLTGRDDDDDNNWVAPPFGRLGIGTLSLATGKCVNFSSSYSHFITYAQGVGGCQSVAAAAAERRRNKWRSRAARQWRFVVDGNLIEIGNLTKCVICPGLRGIGIACDWSSDNVRLLF